MFRRATGSIAEGAGNKVDSSAGEAETKRALDEIERLEKERDAADAAVDAADSEVERYSDEIKAIRAEEEKFRAASSEAAKQTNAMVSDMDGAFRAAFMATKISKLQKISSKMSENMASLRRVYDNAVLGLYVQTKLEDLLASAQMCNAVKNCAGKPTRIDLTPLFAPRKAGAAPAGAGKPSPTSPATR